MKRKLKEFFETIIYALILALFIRTFVVQAFKIPSGSMIPTILIGDHIFVNKFIYGYHIPFTDKRVLMFERPKKGDVIVFVFPLDKSKDFIKRVCGVGGDTIQIVDKNLYVNGKLYHIPQEIHKDDQILPGYLSPRDNFGPVKVPKGMLFVMGDNRDNSYDSRFWGFLPLSYVRGKAWIIYWSWDSKRHRPRWRRIGKLIR